MLGIELGVSQHKGRASALSLSPTLGNSVWLQVILLWDMGMMVSQSKQGLLSLIVVQLSKLDDSITESEYLVMFSPMVVGGGNIVLENSQPTIQPFEFFLQPLAIRIKEHSFINRFYRVHYSALLPRYSPKSLLREWSKR